MDKALNKQKNYMDKAREVILTFFSKKKGVSVSDEKKQLLADIEDALSDLRYAKSCFETAKDPEMIEACIFEIKSAEARYSFLLRKAKRMAANSSQVAV